MELLSTSGLAPSEHAPGPIAVQTRAVKMLRSRHQVRGYAEREQHCPNDTLTTSRRQSAGYTMM